MLYVVEEYNVVCGWDNVYSLWGMTTVVECFLFHHYKQAGKSVIVFVNEANIERYFNIPGCQGKFKTVSSLENAVCVFPTDTNPDLCKKITVAFNNEISSAKGKHSVQLAWWWWGCVNIAEHISFVFFINYNPWLIIRFCLVHVNKQSTIRTWYSPLRVACVWVTFSS